MVLIFEGRKRIAKLINNKRFLDRVYTYEEVRYCSNKKNKAQHFAVRFASKEAVWKTLNDKKITHKDIGVKNLPDGRPEVYIKGKKRKGRGREGGLSTIHNHSPDFRKQSSGHST